MTTAEELELEPITRARALEYLTQCADSSGRHWYQGSRFSLEDCPTCHGTNRAPWLRCFSRYGATSEDCAPVAYRYAYLVARECGDPLTAELLDHAMGAVVNESADVAYVIRTYGWRRYR